MIYVVSGYMRSGTSAMMQALIAGGMDAAWSEERDQLAHAHADEHYHPNRRGLYEVPIAEYGQVTFPLPYQGKLIKVLAWGLDGLAVNPYGYRIVIMRRDKEEIRQSYEAFFERPLTHDWFAEYDARMAATEQRMRNRKDVVSCSVLDYERLIADPLESLRSLGWGFDTADAAACIDASQYRFRKELLVAGI